MPMVEVAGKSIEVDEEGYLTNLADWNKEVADYLAKEEKVEMSDSHWEVVNFLREYYEEYQIAPAVRVLTKAVAKKLGPGKKVVVILPDTGERYMTTDLMKAVALR